jgi:hypothetical protein
MERKNKMIDDITFETSDSTRTKYERTNFLDLSYGLHQARLLSNPKRIFVHYFKGRGSVQCLGSDCPICKVNKSLQVEFPENYRQQPSYNGSSPRHYVNILDRSPVKVCTNPECQHENKLDLMNHFPNSCVKCGVFIADVPVTISNKVKVANISQTNADKLMALKLSVRDDNGEPVGLGNFDIEFLVTTSGGKKDVSVQASSKKNAYDKLDEVPEESLYNLDSAVIKLEPQEMVQFMRGVSLKDIFVAKKAGSTPSIAVAETEKKIEDSIEDTLKKLGF